MRKAFIACGGTGGHLSPGIALAEELAARGWECCLLISRKEVDSRLLNKYPQYRYVALPGSALSLSPVRFAKFAINLFSGTLTCLKRMRAEDPDVVIGFGGFLTMPAMLAGRFRGLPLAVHEANRVAGRVTRVAARFANRVYLPLGVAIRNAKPSRIRFLGMPVRREIRSQPKAKAKAALGLNPDQKALVVMGGSQGAGPLNAWAQDHLEALAQREAQVYCLTGSSAAGDSESSLRAPSGAEVKAVFRRFSDDMPTVLSAADLVVSRAGAGSIAEIMRCRTPAILIPYPYAADNHQQDNALDFERRGCGLTIDQEYLPNLFDEVADLLFNEKLLQTFRANLEQADQIDAQAVIADDLEELAAGRDAESAAEGERRSSHG